MKQINCSACAQLTSIYHMHELLSVPVCEDCNNNYYCGTFRIDDSTGNEMYCRWCGQGEGSLFLCDTCPKSFCERCLENNFGSAEIERLKTIGNLWSCILCSPQPLTDLIQRNRWNEIELPPAKCFTITRPPKPSSVKKDSSGKAVVVDKRIKCFDIARGREKFEIPVINEYDNEPAPLDFVYITRPVVNHGATLTNNPNFLVCCTCEDNCRDASKCECAQASGGRTYTIDGRLMTGIVDGIYECNYKCHCHRRACKNRVVSNGPHLKLELFRCQDPTKGWGVRCKTDIQPGTFIADYVGEIIPEALVEKRGLEKCDQYLFNMDSWARTRACSVTASLGLKATLDKIPREFIVDSFTLDEKGLEEYFDADLIEKLSKSGAVRRAQEKGQRKRKLLEEEERKNPNVPSKSWYDAYLSSYKKDWYDISNAFGDRVIVETENMGQSYTIDAR